MADGTPHANDKPDKQAAKGDSKSPTDRVSPSLTQQPNLDGKDKPENRVQPQQDEALKDRRDTLESLDEQVKQRQDHLLDLKRKVESRQQLLGKLRDIGEGSKTDSAEFYFKQLTKASDELQLKDKQLSIHLERIRDLERLLATARAQANESGRLSIQLRAKEEEADLARQELSSQERMFRQEMEKTEFRLKNSEEQVELAQEQVKRQLTEVQEGEKRFKEADKSRQQLQSKLEELLKQNEKAGGEVKTESGRADKLREEVEMLKALLDSEKKRAKEAQLQVEQLLKDKKVREADIKGQEDTYGKLKKDMEKLMDSDKIQRGVLESEIKDMRSTIHEQREKINRLDDELLELQKRKLEHSDAEEVDRLRQDNNNLLDELRRNMEELLKLEELEGLKPIIAEKDRDIARLEKQVQTLQDALGRTEEQHASEDKRFETLQKGLVQADSAKEKMAERLEQLQRDKKQLQEKMKLKDQSVEEKAREVEKTIEALESVKTTNKKLKQQIDKLSKDKEDMARRLERVMGDFAAVKKAKDELQELLDRMTIEFEGMRDKMTKKDEWVLRQGQETKTVAEQLNLLKKKHGDYRLETEIEYGKVMNEKNTEIMVLREMIKSTKSMVRAKDVDLQRLRRKLQVLESEGGMNGVVSDEEKANVSRMSMGKSKLPGVVKSLAKIKPPAVGRTLGKGQKLQEQTSLDDDMGRPAMRLVRGIEEKKNVTVKRTAAEVRQMLEDDEARAGAW